MTISERTQPERTFVHAGRIAFLMMIDFVDNPYKEHPYKSLWERGYKVAKKRFYDKRGTFKTLENK